MSIFSFIGRRAGDYIIKFCYDLRKILNNSKHNVFIRDVRKLQLVQNYACRIVAGLRKYDHVSEALKSLKWLNVRDKLLFNDLVMVYKCLKNLTPGYLHRRFQYRAKTQQRVTRQNKDLTLPRYRLATGQKTFSYRGAKLYNSIAKDIRDTGNFNAFKKRIFKYLFHS